MSKVFCKFCDTEVDTTTDGCDCHGAELERLRAQGKDSMISTIRKEARYTQRAFALICGVSKSTICDLEQGRGVGRNAQRKILVGALKLLDWKAEGVITKDR